MDLQKVLNVLSLVGAVALALPALLHALLAFLKLVPGDMPDKLVEKVLVWSEKLASLVSKVYPKAPNQSKPE